MAPLSTTAFTLNNRTYDPPARSVVVVCLDGSSDEYLDAALARDLMPNLGRMILAGSRSRARAAMPTYTNVNNASIVTGVPPAVHGIGGNFFLDPASGEEVMMNEARFLRAPTIFPAAQRSGRRVAVVTAKEKLRGIFAAGLIAEGGIAFSAEQAAAAVLTTHGIDGVEALVGRTPAIYSGEASLYVLRAGVALLAAQRADFLYLSTTDFIQHKFEPSAPEALEFYAKIDAELGRLLDLGAGLSLTADHGMNAKQRRDGSPQVIFLESELSAQFGPGIRVILPITDPYVTHHGALGSFAQIHLPAGVSPAVVQRWLLARTGITEAHDQFTGARLLELPPDRSGDVIAVSARDVVLGRTPEAHDLSGVLSGLRSHGGRYEEMVPFVTSEPLNAAYSARARGDLRNFDIFDFACNGGH
jgi:phosphonoacetate hydrolase